MLGNVPQAVLLFLGGHLSIGGDIRSLFVHFGKASSCGILGWVGDTLDIVEGLVQSVMVSMALCDVIALRTTHCATSTSRSAADMVKGNVGCYRAARARRKPPGFWRREALLEKEKSRKKGESVPLILLHNATEHLFSWVP